MRREVRQMFGLLTVPLIVWCLVSSYYVVRANTGLGFKITQKPALQVSTHLVGRVFVPAFPDEMVSTEAPSNATSGEPTTFLWQSEGYRVRLDTEKKIMTVQSPHFMHDALLKYDGWRWCGFTNIPDRKSPIQVNVW